MNLKENKIIGGLSDNLTLEDIAKKHNVSIDYLEKQLELGIEVESEHTSDKEVQKEIAMDHLSEKANYYEDLKLIEKKTMKISEAIKLIEAKTGKKVSLQEKFSNKIELDYSKYRKGNGFPMTPWSKFMSNFNFDINDMDRICKHLGYDNMEELVHNNITPAKIKSDKNKLQKLKQAVRSINTMTRDMTDGGMDMLVEKNKLKENVTNEQRMLLPENIRKCIPAVVYPLLEKIEMGEGSFILTIKKGRLIGYTLFYRLLKQRILFGISSTMKGQTQILIQEV